MSHLDEGRAHAFLDGALDEKEHGEVEQHIASCQVCADRVAEARGFIAAASQVVTKLDVLATSGKRAARGSSSGGSLKAPQRRWLSPPMLAAASLAVVAVGSWLVVRNRTEREEASSPAVAVAPPPVVAAVPPPAETKEEKPTSPPPEFRSQAPAAPAPRPAAAMGSTDAAPGVRERAAKQTSAGAPPTVAASTADRALNSLDPRQTRADSVGERSNVLRIEEPRRTTSQTSMATRERASLSSFARRAAMVDSMVNVFSGCYTVTRGERAVAEGFPSKIALLTRVHRRIGDSQTWIATEGTTVPPAVMWEWSLDAAFQVVVTRVPDGAPLSTTFTSAVRADVLLRRTDCR